MKCASIFTLENFEGPLDFLLNLIYQNEINIYEVPIQKIMQQYVDKEGQVDVDSGAEFIAMASLLLFLKSRMLLPKHEQPLHTNEDLDPKFDIIHQLIDYCRFKEVAKDLTSREDHQSSFFGRGIDAPFETKKNLGIEHLTLDDLAKLFHQIATRANSNKGQISEEVWLVSDKITFIRKSIILNELEFNHLFNSDLSREELIVTFLALLELMKLGEVLVIKDSGLIFIKNREPQILLPEDNP